MAKRGKTVKRESRFNVHSHKGMVHVTVDGKEYPLCPSCATDVAEWLDTAAEEAIAYVESHVLPEAG